MQRIAVHNMMKSQILCPTVVAGSEFDVAGCMVFLLVMEGLSAFSASCDVRGVMTALNNFFWTRPTFQENKFIQ